MRGPFHSLRLAETPPHPTRKSAPTSPRKRGEVKAAATSDHPLFVGFSPHALAPANKLFLMMAWMPQLPSTT